MRTLPLVAALFLFSSAAAAATPSPAAQAAASASEQQEAELVQDGGELGFFDKYFPLSLNVTHASVEDNKVGLWIGTILPFGFLWSPFVFGEERPGDDFILDAIIIALVHIAPYLLWFVAVIPVIGWVLAPFLGIGLFIYTWVNLLYLTPVAIINAYDRSLGAGGGGTKKRRPRRRRRSEATLPAAPSLAAGSSATGAFAY